MLKKRQPEILWLYGVMNSEGKVIFSPSLYLFLVLCWICWGSSWGFWTWSKASVEIHHFVPSPPLWGWKTSDESFGAYCSIIQLKVIHVRFCEFLCLYNTLKYNKYSVNCKHLLTEAEEECVNTHVVHTEESMSYEVATKHHRLQKNTDLVKAKQR